MPREWTEEDDNFLREADQTMTISQQAEHLGVTRAAVSGRRNRLKLTRSDRNPSHKKPGRKPWAPKPFGGLKPEPDLGGVLFKDLRVNQCAYPLGGLEDPLEEACGAPVSEHGSAYCDRHRHVVYLPPDEKKRVAYRDRPAARRPQKTSVIVDGAVIQLEE